MTSDIRIGDCRDVLPALAAEGLRAQTCVTSPPYWGLRQYGAPRAAWGPVEYAPMAGLPSVQVPAWEGELGLEPDPWMYVGHLVEAFRAVRQVLARDATLWLVIGDSYAGTAPGNGRGMAERLGLGNGGGEPHRSAAPKMGAGLKPKDLVGIPWMVAKALQADGWWLRSAVTWCKPNGMPESVSDRPTVATEMVFMLSANERYHYDAAAVCMPPAESSIQRWAQYLDGRAGSSRANGGAKTNGAMKAVGGPRTDKQRGHSRRHAGFNARWDEMERAGQVAGGANLRNFWIIPPEGFSGAHFAVMPRALATICILAGSRPGDVVLDPFAGSGTVGEVAQRLGRRAVLIEAAPHYARLIRERTAQSGLALGSAA
jgi:DNA modification methylase